MPSVLNFHIDNLVRFSSLEPLVLVGVLIECPLAGIHSHESAIRKHGFHMHYGSVVWDFTFRFSDHVGSDEMVATFHQHPNESNDGPDCNPHQCFKQLFHVSAFLFVSECKNPPEDKWNSEFVH